MEVKKVLNPLAPGQLLADLGIGSWDKESDLSVERSFGFTIENNTGLPKKVYFTPSLDPTDPTMVVRDGDIIANLTCTAIGIKSIAQFQRHISTKPSRLMSIQLESDSTAQLSQQLTLQTKGLFGDEQPRSINLSLFKSTSAFNNKLIVIKAPQMQLDIDTECGLVIPGLMIAGVPSPVTSTFTFYFGAIYSESEIMYKLGMNYGS